MVGKSVLKGLSFSALFIGGMAHVPVSAADDYTITFRPFPEIASSDGQFSGRVFGFVQTDAAFNIDDDFDHPSGTTVRRARMGVRGTMYGTLSYVLDFEFGNGANGQINDVVLEYRPNDKWSFAVGQNKDQTSLEFVSSVKHRAFPDAAFNFTLVPKRRLGLDAVYAEESFAASLQLSGENVNQRAADDEGYSVTGRLSYAPIRTEDLTLHIGGAINWSKPDDASRSVSYAARHETSASPFAAVSTGAITDVDSVTVYNVDTFAKTASVWVMGEYTRSRVNRFAGFEDPTFKAWYVQAGWVLTGENRSYRPKTGVGGVRPKASLREGGPGAVELAVRYDTLDLTDGGVLGGETERYSVNLLWYPFDFVQLRASLQAGNNDELAAIPNDKPKALIFRAFWEF